jgi:FtsH-binding integral membrane protein
MKTQSNTLDVATDARDDSLAQFFSNTYRTMSLSLAITGLVAWAFGRDMNALRAGDPTQIIPAEMIAFLFSSPTVYVVMFAPLVLVMFFGTAMRNMPSSKATWIVYILASLIGISLSTIFVRYTGTSIAQVFFISAGSFAALSVYGMTTKKDLGPMGAFMFMGLIGLVICSVINIFLVSDGLSFAIGLIGVVVFAGLTAWDTQKLKNMYLEIRAEGASDEDIARLSVMGALTLYLDALNLFLSLLRIFGDSRN